MAQHTYWTGEGDRILIDAAPRDLFDWEPVIIGGAHGLAGASVRAGKGFSLIVQGEYRVGIEPAAIDHAIGDRVYIMGQTFTAAMSDADDPTTAVGILATDLPAGATSALIRLVGADPQAAPVGGDVDAPTTGQFNALKDRVSANETELAGHETRIDALEASGGGGGGGGADPRVDQLEEDVQSLDGRVTTLENAGGGGGGGGGVTPSGGALTASMSEGRQVTTPAGQSAPIEYNLSRKAEGTLSFVDGAPARFKVSEEGIYVLNMQIFAQLSGGKADYVNFNVIDVASNTQVAFMGDPSTNNVADGGIFNANLSSAIRMVPGRTYGIVLLVLDEGQFVNRTITFQRNVNNLSIVQAIPSVSSGGSIAAGYSTVYSGVSAAISVMTGQDLYQSDGLTVDSSGMFYVRDAGLYEVAFGINVSMSGQENVKGVRVGLMFRSFNSDMSVNYSNLIPGYGWEADNLTYIGYPDIYKKSTINNAYTEGGGSAVVYLRANSKAYFGWYIAKNNDTGAGFQSGVNAAFGTDSNRCAFSVKRIK